MKKFYATLLLALVATLSFAQEQNDTVYVMVNFNDNPWNYNAPDVTSGWSPSLKYENEFEGLIWEEKHFPWSLGTDTDQQVDITVYPGDYEEFPTGPALATYEMDAAEAAGVLEEAGRRIILYTAPGTTMRFKAPQGYKFGKILFHTFRNSNFMVGDEYEEPYVYVYNNSEFKSTLKCWTPAAPKKSSKGFDTWEGDETNILFNYVYFTAHFVKIDIRLVPDGTAGIVNHVADERQQGNFYDLQGRRLKDAPRHGVYVSGGKKVVK